MRDLYRGIGLNGREHSEETISDRVSRTANTSPHAAHEAAFVLLNPARRRVYDRAYSTVSKIAEIRLRLRLDATDLWQQSQCDEFLNNLRDGARREKVGTKPPRLSRRVPWRAAILLIVLLLPIAVAIFGAATDRPAPHQMKEFAEQPKAPVMSATDRAAAVRERRIRNFVIHRMTRDSAPLEDAPINDAVALVREGVGYAPPQTGVIYQRGPGVAPLEIKTQSGANYFVKLVDWNTNNVAMSAFIRGGDRFDVEVPLGV